MSAIQTIVDTYIRFADEKALLALKAHRLKLLATIDADDPFFRNLRNQCVEEIAAIEAGLEQLRPPPPVPLHVPTPMPIRAPMFMPAPEPVPVLEAEPEPEPEPEVQPVLQAAPEPEVQPEPEPEPQAELIAPVIDVPEAESAEAETVTIAEEPGVDEAKADEVPVPAHMAALAFDFAAPAAEPPTPPEPQIAKRPRVDASMVAGALLTASLAGSRPTGPNEAVDLINLQQRIVTRFKP